MLNLKRIYRIFRQDSRGFTLIEVMIAIALLGVIVIAFLGALSTASKALFTADERTTAESLARSEMEYVREQDYYMAPWFYELPPTFDPTPWDASHTLPTGYDDYTVSVTAVPLPDDGIDNGIQKITVTINHEDEVITLESYKSGR